jgi:hypothetical protein
MKELDYLKLFFEKQFDKFGDIEFGFKYEYNSITSTHLVEVSNEELFSKDEFNNDAFSFAMNFMEIYNEFVLFIKPCDLIKISRIDYSKNNFDKKYDYLIGNKSIDSLITSILSDSTKNLSNFQGSANVIKVSTFATSNTRIYYTLAA